MGASRRDLSAGYARRRPIRSLEDAGSIPATSKSSQGLSLRAVGGAPIPEKRSRISIAQAIASVTRIPGVRDIITKSWGDFEPIFLKQPWITQRLEELKPPRNIVGHNNPLSKQEENRVDLYFNDWIALLNDRRDVVP